MINLNSDDLLTTDSCISTSSYVVDPDNESNYEWVDTLCILLCNFDENNKSFITIDCKEGCVVRRRSLDPTFGPKTDKSFFKMRTGSKPGTQWTKILDYDIIDYQNILDNDNIIDKLEATLSLYYITGIKTSELIIRGMKAELRELQINKVID